LIVTPQALHARIEWTKDIPNAIISLLTKLHLLLQSTKENYPACYLIDKYLHFVCMRAVKWRDKWEE